MTKRLLEIRWRDPDEEPELHLFGQLKRITKTWLDNQRNDAMKVKSVNSEVLRWARETAGYSLEDVADKTGKPLTVLEDWESGKDYPTYVQLEKLAYQIYKRPLALFFFPEPPEEETPQQSFRTLPEQEIGAMPPRMHYLRRKAQAMQIDLAELYAGANPADKKITRDLRFQLGDSVQNMAATVRSYLGIDLAEQSQWHTAEDAFKAWRDLLEEHSVFIFKDAFKDDGFSGFCLYDEEFPVIYINNSTSGTCQNFTLFHELAHLLFHTGGIDFRAQDYLKRLHGDNKKIEMICNRFSSEFLIPTDDFNAQAKNIEPHSKNDIQRLAKRYGVSTEAILRKLLDKKLVDQEFYETKAKEWRKNSQDRVGSGNYYNNQIAYLGTRFIERAFVCYYQNRISIEELAGYLNMKVKSVQEMEAMVIR